MQIILTEEEYTALKLKADKYLWSESSNASLKRILKELQEKYAKLLIHGVVASNEQLKSTLKQGQ